MLDLDAFSNKMIDISWIVIKTCQFLSQYSRSGSDSPLGIVIYCSDDEIRSKFAANDQHRIVKVAGNK